jgi:hypothetical protein
MAVGANVHRSDCTCTPRSRCRPDYGWTSRGPEFPGPFSKPTQSSDIGYCQVLRPIVFASETSDQQPVSASSPAPDPVCIFDDLPVFDFVRLGHDPQLPRIYRAICAAHFSRACWCGRPAEQCSHACPLLSSRPVCVACYLASAGLRSRPARWSWASCWHLPIAPPSPEHRGGSVAETPGFTHGCAGVQRLRRFHNRAGVDSVPDLLNQQLWVENGRKYRGARTDACGCGPSA